MSKPTQKKVRRRGGRGTILIIALLLVGSAVARLATGSGFAVAQAISNEVRGGAEQEEAMQGQNSSITTAQTVNRPELGRLLTELQNREARVAERERQIEMRSKALAVADMEIEKRLIALAQVEADLRRTLALADGAAEEDLARLTSVYENMKPKEAAALFETMEPDFAAGFLGRMRPDAAAAVMAGLPPEVAYSISVILAGRNASVPKT